MSATLGNLDKGKWLADRWFGTPTIACDCRLEVASRQVAHAYMNVARHPDGRATQEAKAERTTGT